MNPPITIGTRGSQLALWQSQYIKTHLNNHFPDLEINFKIIKTTGDTIQNRTLVGLGKGVFTKEIELALLNEEIDLAVHSLKDLPTELPKGLCIAAIPAREDPRDVLITSTGFALDDLLSGAKIGTTSPRRKSQLLHMRPDLQVVDVRGNIDTRLRKLNETDLDGIILAAAGIKRLLNEDIITEYFDIDHMVPAVGQGALAVEARQDDLNIEDYLKPLIDLQTTAEITAERAVLTALGGGCQLPIGAYAEYIENELTLIAMVCHPDGNLRILERNKGELENAKNLGNIVATKLRNSGADELLKAQSNIQ